MSISLPVLNETSRSENVPRAARVSLTDRCDMACVYCRPKLSPSYIPSDLRLNHAAWKDVLAGLKSAGIERVRFTGGEPLLYPRLTELVHHAVQLGFADVSLTTNGSQLEWQAGPLRQAGLSRINISIDSLDPGRYRRITRGGRLERVLSGVDAACTAGFSEIKTNTVVMARHNEDEMEAITLYAWNRGITPRFIELMNVGEGQHLTESFVPYARMRQALGHLLSDDSATSEPNRGPARYVRSRSGSHRVGFITGTSNTFCDNCDRVRVTAAGMVRACLATPGGVQVDRGSLETNAQSVVRQSLLEAWGSKPTKEWRGCNESSAASIPMHAIGG